MRTIELLAEEYLHFCLIVKQDVNAPSMTTTYFKNRVVITCNEKYLENLGY